MHGQLFLVAIALLLAGCVATPPAPAGDTARIVHSVQGDLGNVFDPPRLAVKAGESVTWDVVGIGHHTVTFHASPNGTGAGPDSGDVGPGGTFTLAFPTAGTYTYWCRYHSDGTNGMAGSIVVT